MRRAAIILCLIFLASLTGGCSDDNSSAPATDQPHLLGARWLLPDEHPKAAIENSPPCFECHVETGGESNAPDCSRCHTAGPPNFVLGTCDSCHDAPPDGDTRPNRAGAHAPHNALPRVTGVCESCHKGAGSGTLKHYDTSAPANVAFLTPYNAKTGPATFTPDPSSPGTGTCSNVSCHGGQQTPDWASGRIDVDQDCTSCHQVGTAFQTPQYNSPYSGQHRFHVESLRLNCTVCHDPAQLEGEHFIGLDTSGFEGNPAATLRDFTHFDPQTQTCTNNNSGVCHDGETRSWTGGGD